MKIKGYQMDNIGKWQITFTNFMASMNAENNIIKPDTKIGFEFWIYRKCKRIPQ